REEAQPGRVGGADDRARRLHALAMAGHARQAALGRPAPVAVHDDGDVGGHRVRADGLQQRGLGGAGHQKDMISCSFFFRSSSVGVGIVSRMTLPSFTGWMPRSDFMIAFSTSLSWAASHGWIMSVRASGTETEAI